MKKILLILAIFSIMSCSNYEKGEIYECILNDYKELHGSISEIESQVYNQGIPVGSNSRETIVGFGSSFDKATKDSDNKAKEFYSYWARKININDSNFPVFKGSFSYSLVRYVREEDGTAKDWIIIESRKFTKE